MRIIINENGRDALVLDWLNKTYGDLKPYRGMGTSSGNIYYCENNGDEAIFHYNKKTMFAYLNNAKFLRHLTALFGLSDKDVHRIIKTWITQKYEFPLINVRIMPIDRDY